MNRVFNHSCESMPELAEGSVSVCVTSPPYFNQRDYETEGQIGMEETPAEYVAKIVAVFREVHRVLTPQGTAFLNLGDSYFGDSPIRKASSNFEEPWDKSMTRSRGGTRRSAAAAEGLKPKDLMMIPHRVAIALQQDGWWVRDDIVWAKPNPMPSPVNDRCTPSKEYVFHLTKSRRYFANMEAVKQPLTESYARDVATGSERANFDRDTSGRTIQRAEQRKLRKQDALGKQTYTGFNDRWKQRKADGAPSRHGLAGVSESEVGERGEGANLRNVWTIATEPYPGEHFAVMPRELVRRCILIGSEPDGLVLDPFMGSGTVAEVAIGCGRKFVGYELSEKYCGLIRDRLGLFGEGVA